MKNASFLFVFIYLIFSWTSFSSGKGEVEESFSLVHPLFEIESSDGKISNILGTAHFVPLDPSLAKSLEFDTLVTEIAMIPTQKARDFSLRRALKQSLSFNNRGTQESSGIFASFKLETRQNFYKLIFEKEIETSEILSDEEFRIYIVHILQSRGMDSHLADMAFDKDIRHLVLETDKTREKAGCLGLPTDEKELLLTREHLEDIEKVINSSSDLNEFNLNLKKVLPIEHLLTSYLEDHDLCSTIFFKMENAHSKGPFYNRNIQWISKISMIHHEDRNALFAFGFAHLFGPIGVLNLLKKEGFKVRALNEDGDYTEEKANFYTSPDRVSPDTARREKTAYKEDILDALRHLIPPVSSFESVLPCSFETTGVFAKYSGKDGEVIADNEVFLSFFDYWLQKKFVEGGGNTLSSEVLAAKYSKIHLDFQSSKNFFHDVEASFRVMNLFREENKNPHFFGLNLADGAELKLTFSVIPEPEGKSWQDKVEEKMQRIIESKFSKLAVLRDRNLRKKMIKAFGLRKFFFVAKNLERNDSLLQQRLPPWERAVIEKRFLEIKAAKELSFARLQALKGHHYDEDERNAGGKITNFITESRKSRKDKLIKALNPFVKGIKLESFTQDKNGKVEFLYRFHEDSSEKSVRILQDFFKRRMFDK